MNKKQRAKALVVMDALLLSVNLGVYFTYQNNFALGFAVVFMFLFIFDWNVWLKK